ncbi:MAG: lactate racemase domain-containing protein [Candidatus Bathyarchaeia archaeon]
MKSDEVFIPNLAWYGDEPLKLDFPPSWTVNRCMVECEKSTGLDENKIYYSLENPIGVKPLSKLAEKSEEVVILIDDMTRPTKSRQFVIPILNILRKAKVKPDNIRFIMASGSHGTFGRLDFVKKLGEDIAGEYPCFNHNPYEYLEYLGETSRGTPIYVNAEYMSCDLRIGVGTILFHRLMGFSGGGKMIMPGIAGIDSIKHNHGDVGGFGPGLTPHPSTGYLKNEGNEMRLDAEEFAKKSGLHFKIDSVLNLLRDPIEVYAGDFIKTQRMASESALKWHKCPAPADMDIVVANTYARANEAQIGMWPAYQSVKKDGSIVLIANAPDGEINHWIFGRHGKNRGARLWNPVRHPLQKGRRLIIYSPYKERTHDMRIGLPEQTVWIKDWAEVIEILKAEHGPNARVAVIPDATLGIPENI